MHDAPARILLIIAPSQGAALHWAKENGFWPALALGSARIITKAGSLRGWRAGTIFVVTGWEGTESSYREVNAVLGAVVGLGSLRAASAEDLSNFKREVLA